MAEYTHPLKTFLDKASQEAPFNGARGLHGEFRGATPKYSRGPERIDYRDTMARMFLQLRDFTHVFDHAVAHNKRFEPLLKVFAGSDAGARSDGVEAPFNPGFVDFLLENVTMGFRERTQITELLADDYVLHAFGEHVPMFTFSGVVLNTKQDDHAVDLFLLYEEFFRAVKLAQRTTLLSIRFDSWIASGAVLGLTLSLNASNESFMPFNLEMAAKQILPTVYVNADVTQLDGGFAAGFPSYGSLLSGLNATDITNRQVTPAAVQSFTPAPEASAKTEPKKDPPVIQSDATVDAMNKANAAAAPPGSAPTVPNATGLYNSYGM